MKYLTILALVVLLALVYAEKNGTKCNVKGTWKAYAQLKTNPANGKLNNVKGKVTLEYNGDGSISQTRQESQGDCKCKQSVTAFHWEYLARRNFSTTLNITKGSTVKCSDSLGSCTTDKCKDTSVSYQDYNCTYIKKVNNFTQNILPLTPVIVTYLHNECDEADIPTIEVSGPLGFTISGTATCNRQNWFTSTTAYIIYAIIIVIVLIVIVAVVALAAIALLKKKRTVGYEEA